MDKLEPHEKKMLKALNWQEGTKFKSEQLMEWSCAEIKPHEGEKVFKVNEFGLYIAIKL
jgi:hypothetical protein